MCLGFQLKKERVGCVKTAIGVYTWRAGSLVAKGRRIRAKLDLLVTSGSLHVLKPLYIGAHAILQGVCLGFRNGPPPDVVVLGDCKAIR